MNILDTLKGYEHTFAAWIAKEYQAFRKEEPTLIALSDRVFPYVKSAVQIGLSLEGQGALSAAAGALLDKIHAEADTAASLLYDFGATPTLSSSLATIESDISSIESVAGIKSTAAQSAIAKALSNVQALSAAVSGAIAAAVTPAPAASPAPATT